MKYAWVEHCLLADSPASSHQRKTVEGGRCTRDQPQISQWCQKRGQSPSSLHLSGGWVWGVDGKWLMSRHMQCVAQVIGCRAYKHYCCTCFGINQQRLMGVADVAQSCNTELSHVNHIHIMCSMFLQHVYNMACHRPDVFSKIYGQHMHDGFVKQKSKWRFQWADEWTQWNMQVL